MNRFDAIRAAHPDLALALYAMTPGGVVTLEIITPDGAVFPFTGLTADAALDLAFPPAPTADMLRLAEQVAEGLTKYDPDAAAALRAEIPAPAAEPDIFQ